MTITQISPEAIFVPETKAVAPRGTKDIDSGHCTDAAHLALVAVEQIPPRAKACSTPATAAPAGGTLPSPTEELPAPDLAASATESNIDSGRMRLDAQQLAAAVEQSPRDRAIPDSAQPERSAPGLADPTLALAAAVVDDLERTRISNENRLRQLTRTETDSDGEERGFGLDESHPDVARLAAIVAGLAKLEHDAVLGLQRQMRKHPMGPWVKAQVGIGEKQAARLLAAIGDPYWNTLHDRPRTVSQLWAYCGLHVVPGGLGRIDAHVADAAGGQTCDPDSQLMPDNHGSPAVGVAARRRKGQKANWSADAKMRAYLIATSCMKQRNSPFREVYDNRRAHTAVTHPDWTDGHSHNDALRVTAKAVLREMWREAKRISEETP